MKRATERAELAESKLRDVEQELETVGENMKQLEISAEKAQEREEKLKDKIHQLMERLKVPIFLSNSSFFFYSDICQEWE